MAIMSLHQGSWWSLLIKGIAAIVFGILALAWPGEVLSFLITLLGIFVLIIGIVATIGGLMHRRDSERWLVMLIPGLVGIVIGIIAIAQPAIIAAILIYLLAIWALIHGITEIYAALKLRKDVKGEWVPLIVGITSVVLGILLILRPLTAGAIITWLIGLFLLVLGAFWLILAVRARSWGSGTET